MPPRRAVNRASALGGAVLLLALCGCTHDATARPRATAATADATASALPDVTPGPTPTPTPTSLSAPTRPAELSGPPSTDTALEAGRYYLSLLDYAYTTQDDASLRAFSDSNCSFCSVVTQDIAHQRTVGQHSVGGEVTVTGASSKEVNRNEYYTANFRVQQAPSRIVDAAGNTVDSGAGGEFLFDVGLYYRGGGWIVAAVDVTPSDSK